MLRGLLAAGICLVVMGGYAWAGDAAERVAQSIDDTVMSPFCPGRTLSACPSDRARELRDEVRSWADEGASYEQIRARLTERFGDVISGTPVSPAMQVLSWAGPALFLLLLALLLVRRFFGRPNEAVERPREGAPSAEVQAEIERELAMRMKG